MQKNDGLFISTNLSIGKRIFYHIDNSDFQEDSGVQTHVLLVVGFQETDENDVNKIVIPDDFETKRSATLVENSFGELKPCKKPLKCEFQRTNACSNFQLDKVPNPNRCTELNMLGCLSQFVVWTVRRIRG